MLSFVKWLVILFVTIIFLTACGENPANTVYEHLEAAVELEQPFEDQQEPLQKAEIRENDLFEQIIALGMNDFEEIVQVADEAISSIQARENMIMKEKESIEESFQEFKKIEGEVEKIEDFELNDVLTDLVKVMQERYDHYQQLYDSYSEAIHLDKTLFEMLQEEELVMEDLQNQIDNVNEAYEKVEGYKEEFNKTTDEYNQLKREFYEKAELNVQFE
ncbi:YkyA family protein [Halalkalibacter kiskunsagensis]|uniref:YkyA family protein n=1 Tax=Halalkalibacter kiskunsagensis TaxID=1548599 RepID=A0ABV6KCC4_9BACI